MKMIQSKWILGLLVSGIGMLSLLNIASSAQLEPSREGLIKEVADLKKRIEVLETRFPPGVIVAWAGLEGVKVPEGWWLCEGGEFAEAEREFALDGVIKENDFGKNRTAGRDRRVPWLEPMTTIHKPTDDTTGNKKVRFMIRIN